MTLTVEKIPLLRYIVVIVRRSDSTSPRCSLFAARCRSAYAHPNALSSLSA